MVGAALGMRLRADSAAAVEGVSAPWELPWREPAGCWLLLAPVGVRSPSAMAVVAGRVQSVDGGSVAADGRQWAVCSTAVSGR